MRLRNVKGSREKIKNDEYTIKEPETKKGKWSKVFGNCNPIHIEIGMGKGKFISELAIKNPNINYIGIEKYSNVLVRALEKRENLECNNLYFIRMNAEYITDIFEKEEVSQIYLNFSDPWPKDRHAKRRLTSEQFLSRYDKILKRNGSILFKTDNKELFDFSLEQIQLANWNLRCVTTNLHQSEYNKENIMTEYEERFSMEGKPIHYLIAYREV